MFSWIKNSKKEKKPAYAPEHTIIYAIGDIHGRYDLLQKLHELIKNDSASAKANIRKVIIYIGDYIDRGLESRQVIDSFVNTEIEGFERIFIKGNHEYAMINFLSNPETGDMWLTWGGYSTIQSYGVSLTDIHGNRQNMDELSLALNNAVPADHIEFLNNLKISHMEADYIFVHAGVRPGIEFNAQSDEDMMMIRGEFVYSDNPIKDKTVVFGHTIFEEAFNEAGKIGIDTGAYATGKLTAVVLEGSSVKFIST